MKATDFDFQSELKFSLDTGYTILDNECIVIVSINWYGL